MKKIVVYCHGYGSSANTDKVNRLKEAGFDVYAWDIDVDPAVSLPFLQDKVVEVLLSHFSCISEVKLIFVGTSLGGWYATHLANIYGAHAIAVNPAYNPAKLLPKIGVPKEVADKYTENMCVGDDISIIVAANDEVIDFFDPEFVVMSNESPLFITDSGGHRFNGPEFDMVIEKINAIS